VRRGRAEELQSTFEKTLAARMPPPTAVRARFGNATQTPPPGKTPADLAQVVLMMQSVELQVDPAQAWVYWVDTAETADALVSGYKLPLALAGTTVTFERVRPPAAALLRIAPTSGGASVASAEDIASVVSMLYSIQLEPMATTSDFFLCDDVEGAEYLVQQGELPVYNIVYRIERGRVPEPTPVPAPEPATVPVPAPVSGFPAAVQRPSPTPWYSRAEEDAEALAAARKYADARGDPPITPLAIPASRPVPVHTRPPPPPYEQTQPLASSTSSSSSLSEGLTSASGERLAGCKASSGAAQDIERSGAGGAAEDGGRNDEDSDDEDEEDEDALDADLPRRVVIVHDGERCAVTPNEGIDGSDLYDAVVHAAVTMYLHGNSERATSVDPNVLDVHWHLVLPREPAAKAAVIAASTRDDLRDRGVRIVTPSTRGTVEQTVAALLERVERDLRALKRAARKRQLVVLLPGDGNHALVLKTLRQLGVPCVLVHSGNARSGMCANVRGRDGFSMDTAEWPALLNRSRRATAPPTPDGVRSTPPRRAWQ
jgi:hypothetical protein